MGVSYSDENIFEFMIISLLCRILTLEEMWSDFLLTCLIREDIGGYRNVHICWRKSCYFFFWLQNFRHLEEGCYIHKK